MTRRVWSATARHTAAVMVGLIVFSVVFTYTGDADLLFAVGSGIASGLLVYLAVHTYGFGFWRR